MRVSRSILMTVPVMVGLLGSCVTRAPALTVFDPANYQQNLLSAARALVATQLVSGGWYHWIEFDPEQRLAWCYRRPPSGCAAGQRATEAFHDNDARDASTLDETTLIALLLPSLSSVTSFANSLPRTAS